MVIAILNSIYNFKKEIMKCHKIRPNMHMDNCCLRNTLINNIFSEVSKSNALKHSLKSCS